MLIKYSKTSLTTFPIASSRHVVLNMCITGIRLVCRTLIHVTPTAADQCWPGIGQIVVVPIITGVFQEFDNALVYIW